MFLLPPGKPKGFIIVLIQCAHCPFRRTYREVTGCHFANSGKRNRSVLISEAISAECRNQSIIPRLIWEALLMVSEYLECNWVRQVGFWHVAPSVFFIRTPKSRLCGRQSIIPAVLYCSVEASSAQMLNSHLTDHRAKKKRFLDARNWIPVNKRNHT